MLFSITAANYLKRKKKKAVKNPLFGFRERIKKKTRDQKIRVIYFALCPETGNMTLNEPKHTPQRQHTIPKPMTSTKKPKHQKKKKHYISINSDTSLLTKHNAHSPLFQGSNTEEEKDRQQLNWT